MPVHLEDAVRLAGNPVAGRVGVRKHGEELGLWRRCRWRRFRGLLRGGAGADVDRCCGKILDRREGDGRIEQVALRATRWQARGQKESSDECANHDKESRARSGHKEIRVTSVNCSSTNEDGKCGVLARRTGIGDQPKRTQRDRMGTRQRYPHSVNTIPRVGIVK